MEAININRVNSKDRKEVKGMLKLKEILEAAGLAGILNVLLVIFSYFIEQVYFVDLILMLLTVLFYFGFILIGRKLKNDFIYISSLGIAITIIADGILSILSHYFSVYLLGTSISFSPFIFINRLLNSLFAIFLGFGFFKLKNKTSKLAYILAILLILTGFLSLFSISFLRIVSLLYRLVGFSEISLKTFYLIIYVEKLLYILAKILNMIMFIAGATVLFKFSKDSP
jgi:hypothetical protein